MPVGFDTDIKRLEGLYEAFPEEIEVREDLNGRHEKPDVEWLIKDILAHGQLETVAVWKDGETPVLAYGFSRWRAISLINERKLTPAPIKIRLTYIKCNERGAFLRNISENRMRNPTSALDDAHNLTKLIESWQMSLEEIAKVYFPAQTTEDELKEALKWIADRLELVKLTPEAEKRVRAGEIDETAAQAISKLKSSHQKELLKKTGKITLADAKAAVKTAKASKPKRERGNKTVKAPKLAPMLKKIITELVETADFEKYDERKTVWIEVLAEKLVALKNYITPEK